MRVWTSDDVLFLLMRKISTHEPRLLLMITQAQNSMPQEYSRHWQDSIFELFSLTCKQILQNFPGCDYAQSKAYRCLSRVEFHSVFFEQVAMTVVKLYPDPSRFEYLTFADFAEVAIICYRPSVHSIFGCPTYYCWSQALSFRARGQSKKKFENSWLEGILDILNEDFR